MSFLAAWILAGAPVYAEMRSAQWTELRDASPTLADRASASNPYRLRPAPGQPVVRESLVEKSALPFRDLLVSWNVDAPPRTAFVVELRVGTEPDGGFSAWMHVGDWGVPAFAPPLAERVVACEGGRVDVDYFRGERTFRSAQVRLRAFATSGEPTLEIRRMRLCFSDVERTVEPLAPPDPRPWGTVLDVPLRSQKTEAAEIAGRICSPTSVAMVLGYRGVDVATLSVAERAFDPAHDLYGNWPRNVQTAWSYGVPGYLTRFSDWAAVERLIAAGTPVVMSIAVNEGQLSGAPYAKTAGHLLVLAGFDREGNCVVNDPASPDPKDARRVYRRDEIETVWFRRGGTAYVFEEKR